MAMIYKLGVGVERDEKKATALLQKGAEQNNGRIQFALGIDYLEHNDEVQAFRWEKKAAESGFAEAQFNLGNSYSMGQFGPQDFTQALFWWHKAAEQNHAAADYNIGYAYAHGEGVPQDFTKAALWYRKSALLNYASAQHNLANAYANGRGVPLDLVQSYAFWSLASDRDEGSKSNLASIIKDHPEIQAAGEKRLEALRQEIAENLSNASK